MNYVEKIYHFSEKFSPETVYMKIYRNDLKFPEKYVIISIIFKGTESL